ncbi:MAG: PrsW family intramembrane metalloprotease [Erysipelotrichaceae bacterium]|nr:PrsW family intramembrane metalloprotease [Erysipelotrichaceae bacterium]
MSLLFWVLAVLPGIVMMGLARYFDKRDKEPIGLLALLFVLGAGACIPAVIVEVIGENWLLNSELNEVVIALIVNFLIVGLSEEFFKYLAMKLPTWKNKAFNYRFDGIVYGVYAAMGFATLENIFYLMDMDIRTALIRAVVTVPSHAVYGVFMGIFYSRAKGCSYAGNKSGEFINKMIALWLPVVLHGFFDFCLTIGDMVFVFIWIVFVIILFYITYCKLVESSKSDELIEVENVEQPVYGKEDNWFPNEKSEGRF